MPRKPSKKRRLFRLFFFLIFITLMGMLTLFSIRFPEDRLFLDSPVPIKPALAHAQPLQSSFATQNKLTPVQITTKPTQAPKPSNVSFANSYDVGFCTFGVASWTKVPSGLGNANMWASGARAMGYIVSTIPKIGAVAQSSAGAYGHVALVVGVSGSQVQIKEMNYKGWNIISYRWTSINSFVYIYF